MRTLEPFRNAVLAERLGADVHWLRERLGAQGRQLTSRTPLGRALDRLDLLASGSYRKVPRAQVPKHFRKGGLKDILLDVYGADIFTHVLRRASSQLDASFERHWPILADGEVLPLRPGVSSRARNLTWELFVGALCTGFATEVRAEEPDVACSFMGTRVGVACKCLYSEHPAKQADRLVEGAKQIESANVECGFVFANVVNLLNQRDLLDPRKVTDGAMADPVAAVHRQAIEIFRRLPLDDLAARLEGGPGGVRSKTRGVLFYAPAFAPAREFGISLATPIAEFFFRRVATDLDWRFVRGLGSALGEVLNDPPTAAPYTEPAVGLERR